MLLNIRYWGRKPPSMVQDYIQKYSGEGDIVLDPFGGSGNIISTAAAINRRVIYSDLNPFANLIAKCTLSPYRSENLKRLSRRIIGSRKVSVEHCGEKRLVDQKTLFSVFCTCGKEVEVRSIEYGRVYKAKGIGRGKENSSAVYQAIASRRVITHEELKSQLKKSLLGITCSVKELRREGFVEEEVVPRKIIYVDSCECGRKHHENPDKAEWVIPGSVSPIHWYPSRSLSYDNGTDFLKKRDVEKVSGFFEPRTLCYLSHVCNLIKESRIDELSKDFLRLAFLTTLPRASRMCRQAGGTWPINSYWIPRSYLVRNPRLTLKRAISELSRFIEKRERAYTIGSMKDVIRRKAEACFLNSDAKNLPLPTNSIDYVVTDPPHTDEAQFFELSLFYNSWLGKEPPYEKEVIVNRKQNKNISDYVCMLRDFGKEMSRVLKPGNNLTTIIHDEDTSNLSEFKNAIAGNHFSAIDTGELGEFLIITFINKKKTTLTHRAN